MRVRAALDDTPTGALRRIAASHGLAVDDATTRGELIDRLSERLADPTYVVELIDALAEDEREALLAARASGGELRGSIVDRDQPGAATALVERGLLFRTFAAAGPRRGEVFTVPDEVLDTLPAPRTPEPPPADAEPPAPAERRATDPVFSLFALASTMQRPSAELAAEVGGWSEEPGGWGWSARWTFLRQLGHASGLLAGNTAGPGLVRALNDPPSLTRRLRRTYVQDRSWSDLTQAGVEHVEEFAEASLVRAAIVNAVEQLPAGAWISVEAFSAWLQRTAPDFLREQLDARGLLLLESRPWAQLEHVLVRYVLLGPLYWLGTLACSADGQLFARRDAQRPGGAEACTWQGTELLAPARAELGTLLDAERYLLLHTRGRPSSYRLLQRHVASALGTGGSVDECRRLLVRLTQAPLPDGVEARLSSWQERFGALTVRPAVLLDARSEAELEAAIGEDAVRPFVQRRLGPTTAEVAAADALELAAALRSAGHLPRVDAALRLVSDARRTYPGLIDEQVLEFLLVSLLAFQHARPERLAELEGALSLLERLERQFSPERLLELRSAAERLAGDLHASPAPATRSRRRATRLKTRRRRPTGA